MPAAALDALGAVVVAVALGDMFVTIFNYDGFTTLATRFHRGWWTLVRAVTRPLPTRARHLALSLGSASMLPATVALWLGLEITGFALMFDGGLRDGSFALKGADASLGTAYYLSAGDISSLTFGDVVARGGLDHAGPVPDGVARRLPADARPAAQELRRARPHPSARAAVTGVVRRRRRS